MRYSKNVKIYLIWGIVAVLSIFRLGLFLRTPYYAIGPSGYDDHYLLDLADSLMRGVARSI